MGVQQIIVSSETLSGATPSYRTAAESALLARSDLKMFFDAKDFVGTTEVSANDRVEEWRSRKLQGANQPKFLAPSEALGVYCDTVPGGTRSELRFGIDMNDNVISGSNNRSMTGNAFAALPGTGNFTIFAMARVKDPASNTILTATQDTTDQFAVTVTSAQLVRVYNNYPATLIGSTAGDLDENYHLLIIKHDRTANQTSITRDTTVIKAATAQTLPTYPSLLMTLGYVTSGGSTDTGQGFALQCFGVISSIDDVTLDLVRDVLDERDP